MRLRPTSLFGRTAITIAATLILFTIVSTGAVMHFVIIPMAKRSADDFAAAGQPAERRIKTVDASHHPTIVAQHEAFYPAKY